MRTERAFCSRIDRFRDYVHSLAVPSRERDSDNFMMVKSQTVSQHAGTRVEEQKEGQEHTTVIMLCYDVQQDKSIGIQSEYTKVDQENFFAYIRAI